jgi:WD40 repeat protein
METRNNTKPDFIAAINPQHDDEPSALPDNIDIRTLLPEELLLNIFSYLPNQSLNNVALTCVLFSRLAFDRSLRNVYPPLDYTKLSEDDVNDKHPWILHDIGTRNSIIMPMSNDEFVVSKDNALYIIRPNDTQPVADVLKVEDAPKSKDKDKDFITQLAKISDHRLASISYHGTIRIWDLETRENIKTWETGKGWRDYSSLAVTKNHVLISAKHSQPNIDLWDLNDLSKDEPLRTIVLPPYRSKAFETLYNEHIYQVFVNDSGQIITINLGNAVHVYDENGERLQTIPKITMSPLAVTLLPDNKLFGITDFGHYNMCLLDIASEKYVHDFDADPANRNSCYISDRILPIGNTGLVLTGGDPSLLSKETGITIWDIRSGQCLTKLTHPHLKSYGVMPDGRIITIGNKDNDMSLRMWRFQTADLTLEKQLSLPDPSNKKAETSSQKPKDVYSPKLFSTPGAKAPKNDTHKKKENTFCRIM